MEDNQIEAQELDALEKLTPIYDQDGKALGILYNGGHEPDYMNYIYPKFHIYIWRDEKIIDLTSAQIKLQIYEYNLETNTKGSLIIEIDPSTEGNFFEYEIPNSPNQVYIILNVYETEWKTYEFDTPVIGTKTAGEDRTFDLNMKLTYSKSEDQTFLQNLLSPILDGITFIVDFFFNFSKHCIDNLKLGVETLFVPEKDFLPEWSEKMQQTVEEKVPILTLPITILSEFVQGHDSYFVEEGAGFSWNPIIINDLEYFPGGSINFADVVQQNEEVARIREIGLMFTNFGISLAFANYLRKKTNIIFGKD